MKISFSKMWLREIWWEFSKVSEKHTIAIFFPDWKMDTVMNQKNYQISFPLYLFSGITPDIFCALLQERTALLRIENFFIFYRS
jgi:hypothetical protein